jgi:hypothetical protein
MFNTGRYFYLFVLPTNEISFVYEINMQGASPPLSSTSQSLVAETRRCCVIIALHILGKLFRFSSERAWHHFATGNLFTKGQFLEWIDGC